MNKSNKIISLTVTSGIAIFLWYISSEDIFQKFMPHKECLKNDAKLISLAVVSNIGIFIAYMGISYYLYIVYTYIVNATTEGRMFIPYFKVFIFLCGFTHFMKVLDIYYGWYWITTIVDTITCVASLITLILLAPFINAMRNLKTEQQYQEMKLNMQQQIDKQKNNIEEYKQKVELLSEQVNILNKKSHGK